jgi:hypothetical protein
VRLDAAFLDDDAEAVLDRVQLLARIDAEDLDLAAIPFAVALEDLDGGGLAGAIGAEQGEDLAGPDVEVDPVDRLDVAVPLGQAADPHRGRCAHAVLYSATPLGARCVMKPNM